MIRLDNSITNSDWTKARVFDFPTIKTLDDFMRAVGDIPLSTFADLPWVQVAPPEIRDAILESVEKGRFASRSEAGRYAANIRWKGHIKDDVQRSIVDRVREFSGLTVKILSGEAPATGFVVAMREHSRIVRDQDFFDPAKGKAILAQYLKDKRDMLVGEQFLGLWHDRKNGEVVLDVVDNIQDRDDAIKIGQERNQQSIWDVVNEEEIDTGGTGDRETIGTESGEATKAVERDDGRGNRDVRREGLRRIFEVYGSEVLKGRFASRSEAGRYAAEIRWQGHVKDDTGGYQTEAGGDAYRLLYIPDRENDPDFRLVGGYILYANGLDFIKRSDLQPWMEVYEDKGGKYVYVKAADIQFNNTFKRPINPLRPDEPHGFAEVYRQMEPDRGLPYDFEEADLVINTSPKGSALPSGTVRRWQKPY